MPQLYLHLLGTPRIELDEAPIVVDRRKATAILIYLLVTRQAHSRDTLASLFWPDYDQRSARANLRRTLSSLKHALGGQFLVISREEVTIERGDNILVDVERFERLLRSSDAHVHSEQDTCSVCLSNLKEAVLLYENDFLTGFTLKDSPGFDDWQLFQTEKLRRQLAQALVRLIQGLTAVGDFEEAITYTQRWLGIDPLHEPAQRRMMQLLTWSGRQAAALRQYQGFEQLLDEELGLPPEEETIKLHETIRARQLLAPEVALPEREAAISSGLAKHNLPPQLTPFIGRVRELAAIRNLLLDESHCRLLTLVGPGGIGKTRLALEAATHFQDSFPDGVYFVSLASIGQPEFIIPTLGESLKVNLQGVSDPKARLLAYLHRRQALLLIDNFEHLLDGAELLSEILSMASEVKVLVTSRERLNLQEEWVFEVPGLPIPRLADLTTGGSQELIEKFDAGRLLLQSARRAKADLSLSNEDVPAIIRLCQLLDGMPLALELAAPWVRAMTWQEIVEEVEHNLDFLSTTLRNVPKRHRSLRAIFEQTWFRLPENEQTVLSKLSVFQGGCSREAAEQVADATLALLSSLVEKALLRRKKNGRYDMHELIRQFADEELRGQPDIYEETLDRHAAYYADLLQQRIAYLFGRSRKEVFSEIAEIDNIYAGWQWIVSQRNVELLDQSVESFHLYLEAKSLLHELEAALHQATSALMESASGDDGLEYEKVANLSDKCKNLVGYLLALRGAVHNKLGRLTKGQALLEQGIKLQSRTTPRDKRREAHSLVLLSLSFHWRGMYSEADSILNEALEYYREVQDQAGAAWCMNRLGSAALMSGRLAEAERLLMESNRINEEVGDLELAGVNRQILGIKAIDCGDYVMAKELLDIAETIIRAENSSFNSAGTMRERGRLFLAQGRYAQAAHAIHSSLELFDESGSEWFKETTLSYLGSLHRQQEDFKKAERFYQQSLAAAEEVNHLKLIAHNLSGLGCVYLDQGQFHKAKEFQHKALSFLEELKIEPDLASVFRHIGHISLIEGENNHSDSGEVYKKALLLAEKHQLAPVALDVLVGWSHLLVSAGEKAEAVELLSLVQGHPASTRETREKAAKHLLQLEAVLPADVYTAALSKGQDLKLWETTTKCMEELPDLTQ